MVSSPHPVTRRGRNIFKQRDVARAVRSVQAAGIAVGGVELLTKDGTTIRILTESAETKRPSIDEKLDAIIARLDSLLKPK
jgi:hypothetical protein